MPLESLKQKRARLVDPRPRWAIVKMNSYGSTSLETSGMDLAIIEMTYSKIVAWADRRDHLCGAFRDYRHIVGMQMPKWFELGAWIVKRSSAGSSETANDMLATWLGAAAVNAERALHTSGYTLIMDDVKFPKNAERVPIVDQAIGIAAYATRPEYSAVVLFARKSNGPEISSYSMAFSAFEKYIEGARQRIAQSRG